MLRQSGLLKKKEAKARIGRNMERHEKIFLDLKARLRLKRTKEAIVKTRREADIMSMAKMLLQIMNDTRKG